MEHIFDGRDQVIKWEFIIDSLYKMQEKERL